MYLEKDQKIYSLEPIIGKDARVFILGSMPGKKSLLKKQYYGNDRNHFWKIIFTILGLEIPNEYSNKVELLKEHHIALWDVIYECVREGSLDSKIKDEEPNDISSFLQNHPTIKLIVFNGNKAFEVFKKHIGLNTLSEVDYKKLPSTSPTPGRNVKSLEEKIKEWRIIEKYLYS